MQVTKCCPGSMNLTPLKKQSFSLIISKGKYKIKTKKKRANYKIPQKENLKLVMICLVIRKFREREKSGVKKAQ